MSPPSMRLLRNSSALFASIGSSCPRRRRLRHHELDGERSLLHQALLLVPLPPLHLLQMKKLSNQSLNVFCQRINWRFDNSCGPLLLSRTDAIQMGSLCVFNCLLLPFASFYKLILLLLVYTLDNSSSFLSCIIAFNQIREIIPVFQKQCAIANLQ